MHFIHCYICRQLSTMSIIIEDDYTEMPPVCADSFEDENILQTLMSKLDDDVNRINARQTLDTQILSLYATLKKNKCRSDAITKKMKKLKAESERISEENNDVARKIRDLQFIRDESNPLCQAATTVTKCEVCHCLRQGMEMSFLTCQHKVCIKCLSRLVRDTCPFCREPIELVHTVEKSGADNWKIVSHVIEMNVNKQSKQHENIFREIRRKRNTHGRVRIYSSRTTPYSIPPPPPSSPDTDDNNSREVWDYINNILTHNTEDVSQRRRSIDEMSDDSMLTNS